MNIKHWIGFVIALFIFFLMNLSLGSVSIPLSEVLKIILGQRVDNQVWSDIIWDFRMTKALTCILAGSALAVGGLQMQTLFRNALAGPDVLGLTSGASLAVSLVFMSGAAGSVMFTSPGPWTVAAAASIGCIGVFLIMIMISRRLRDHVSLLIVGLMIGAGTSSIVSVLQYISKAEELQTYIIWTFGSLGSLSWSELRVMTVIFIVGVTIAATSIKSLNAWLLGDHYAHSIGIKLDRSRMLIIFSTSLLTGGVTAFCGPIAFVGLAVPHLTKLIMRTHNHSILIPAVIIAGAILMLGCDILAQLPGRTQVLPINAITALIGAPVVIWVIMRNRRIRV
jgi:iron complex transport system permease protein